jgi:hypothetical protein
VSPFRNSNTKKATLFTIFVRQSEQTHILYEDIFLKILLTLVDDDLLTVSQTLFSPSVPRTQKTRLPRTGILDAKKAPRPHSIRSVSVTPTLALASTAARNCTRTARLGTRCYFSSKSHSQNSAALQRSGSVVRLPAFNRTNLRSPFDGQKLGCATSANSGRLSSLSRCTTFSFRLQRSAFCRRRSVLHLPS